MKICFYTSVVASGLSLLLSIIIFAVGNSNQSLQAEIQKQQLDLQKQQEQISTGNQISQQVGPNLLRDMAVVSMKNDKMKALLGKHGYNVQQATPAPGAGAPSIPGAPTIPGAAAPAPSSPTIPTVPSSDAPGLR
jgi:hypothetical protein